MTLFHKTNQQVTRILGNCMHTDNIACSLNHHLQTENNLCQHLSSKFTAFSWYRFLHVFFLI